MWMVASGEMLADHPWHVWILALPGLHMAPDSRLSTLWPGRLTQAGTAAPPCCEHILLAKEAWITEPACDRGSGMRRPLWRPSPVCHQEYQSSGCASGVHSCRENTGCSHQLCGTHTPAHHTCLTEAVFVHLPTSENKVPSIAQFRTCSLP